MSADLDLAELRRKAQRHSRGMARGTAYWPAVVLQLLDRLEAAEARTVELVNELDDERVAYAELLAELPGAVAGEPESTPAAEPPIRSYPEFLRRFLPEEAERRRRAGMTPSEVAQEIGREAAAEALAAFTRAADTQEAP